MPTSSSTAEYADGRRAASLLWQKWRNPPEVIDPRTASFAAGALDALVEMQHLSADVDKEMRYYAEAAAEQLTADPFHGILEILQNADDLGAKSLWLAVKRGKPAHLIAVHDGEPVTIPNVIALTLAFLSTKRKDAKAKGRFGIGLKTLNQIGGPLQVHSPPYHFEIDRGTVSRVDPVRAVPGLYDGTAERTMLRLRLNPDVTPEALQAWVRDVDAVQLLFLDAVRSLDLVDARTGRPIAETKISIRRQGTADLALRPGLTVEARRDLVTEAGPRGRSWERYSIEYRVPADLKRAHKETGDATPLAIAVPNETSTSVIAAGLPLGLNSSLPFSINAQFDPESSRRGITQRAWNSWLIDRLGDLVGAVALHRFASAPSSAWQVVPLKEESVSTERWLSAQLLGLVTAVQERVDKTVRLGGARLESLIYESRALDGIVGERDLAALEKDLVPIKRTWRDRAGRWRHVLEDVGGAQEVDASWALNLLEDDSLMHGRPVRWFVRLLDAAIGEELHAELLDARIIVTADGERVAPGSGVLLVRRMDRRGLAARLGLARAIAPDYIGQTAPRRVNEWLERQRVLAEVPDAAGALAALSRLPTEDPRDLDDESIKLVRDALERSLGDDERATLGLAIGKRIRVGGFSWENGKRIRRVVVPGESYLPTAISKETRGWAKAAATTAGLDWIDSRYLRVLRTAGRDEAGARRFFVSLGAAMFPNLVPAGSMSNPAPRPDVIPAAQEELLERYATHLAGDWTSPDLEAVLKDISRQRVDRIRRGRSRALFETITQHWDRLGPKARARSAWYYYTWRHGESIPATWIAQAASEPWLSNKKGQKARPMDLAIDTELTRLTRGDNPAEYVAELGESDSGSPFLAALRIKGTAPASELLSELASLRDKHGAAVSEADVRPHYLALASLCRSSGVQSNVGDVTNRQLRQAFSAGKGLIRTEIGWTTPREVRLGRPIFGNRRTVFSESSPIAPLWRALGIGSPTIDDCLSVLDEIARSNGLESEDRAIVVETLRFIANDDLARRPARRSRLARLPLWTSKGWVRDENVIAIDDRAMSNAIGALLPVWLPGCSLATLKRLPEIRGIKVISSSELLPAPDSVTSSVPASEITRFLFRTAVAHLSNKLAEEEPVLWSQADWRGLDRVVLQEAPNLAVTVRIGRKSVTVPRDLHFERPHLIYFRSEVDVADPDHGGRAIAEFFPPDAGAIIPYGWSYAWRRADTEGPPESLLQLARDGEEADELVAMATNARNAKGRRLFGGGAVSDRKARALQPFARPAPRSLKDFSDARIGTVTIEGGSLSTPKVVKQKARPRLVDPPAASSSPPKDNRAVRDWTDLEKETRGFELLASALKSLDGSDLGDFRGLRNVGADSIDNLKRYFELKVHLGPIPDEVRLEPSEFERAATVEGEGKYFLALVGGLMDGSETVIRVIANPLRTLRWNRSGTLRLGGVRTAHALVITISVEKQSVEP